VQWNTVDIFLIFERTLNPAHILFQISRSLWKVRCGALHCIPCLNQRACAAACRHGRPCIGSNATHAADACVDAAMHYAWCMMHVKMIDADYIILDRRYMMKNAMMYYESSSTIQYDHAKRWRMWWCWCVQGMPGTRMQDENEATMMKDSILKLSSVLDYQLSC
jgi:hypothetical protein